MLSVRSKEVYQTGQRAFPTRPRRLTPARHTQLPSATQPQLPKKMKVFKEMFRRTDTQGGASRISSEEVAVL